MKKFITIILLFLFAMSFSSCYAIVKFFEKNTIEQYSKIMKIANEKICSTSIEIINEKEESQDEIIGVLKIEKLKIEAPVKKGTNSEVLKYAIGHLNESDYWEGNIVLASHNRGSYAHYFENIDKLQIGDKLEYTTKNGSKKYSVVEKLKIKETDWDKALEKKEKNTLTLLTCITGKKEYRLCVKAIEI